AVVPWRGKVVDDLELAVSRYPEDLAPRVLRPLALGRRHHAVELAVRAFRDASNEPIPLEVMQQPDGAVDAAHAEHGPPVERAAGGGGSVQKTVTSLGEPTPRQLAILRTALKRMHDVDRASRRHAEDGSLVGRGAAVEIAIARCQQGAVRVGQVPGKG